jgi:hypothetical protein
MEYLVAQRLEFLAIGLLPHDGLDECCPRFVAQGIEDHLTNNSYVDLTMSVNIGVFF